MEGKFEQIKTVASKNPQILACGNAHNIATAMRKISEQLYKSEADYIDRKMREELGIIDIESEISALSKTVSFMSIIDESEFEIPKQDISSLKKRIKHCKNHMERQRLQKELNALYKEQKRKR